MLSYLPYQVPITAWWTDVTSPPPPPPQVGFELIIFETPAPVIDLGHSTWNQGDRNYPVTGEHFCCKLG